MLTNTCQRWRDRRGTYRPVGEPIDPRHYEVAEIASDNVAEAFVLRHHYSGRYPAARWRFGLYRRGDLVGVAVYSVPFPAAAPEVNVARVELGRFVLLDDVPSNGESWFLARTFEAVRPRTDAIIAFSDPEPRETASGARVFPGHLGTIYQATNATYLGRGPRRTWRLFDDGQVFSARAWSKIRKLEQGWQGAAEQLVQRGAAAPAGDTRAWLAEWVPKLTRAFRHGGSHRYVWTRAVKLAGQAYPKWSTAHANG